MIKNESGKYPSYCRHGKPTNSGMTLIEVVVVIVIIGLLSAIGYPALSKWIPNYQLKAVTRILYADFQKAKIHAVKTNKDVNFKFVYSANCSSPTSYTFTDTAGVVVAGKAMDHGVCLFAPVTPPGPDQFVDDISGFDPRGLPADPVITEKSVKLKHKKIPREYEITQSLAGNISVNQ